MCVCVCVWVGVCVGGWVCEFVCGRLCVCVWVAHVCVMGVCVSEPMCASYTVCANLEGKRQLLDKTAILQNVYRHFYS